ncbi:hypothetical protein Taro_003269, partial [Colocasia esculenta]|nr:hypothetical protein [Colocasia esculenta]
SLTSGIRSGPTQESARRFREVTWVPLHRVVPTTFPLGAPSPLELARGFVPFSGPTKDFHAILELREGLHGSFCNFLVNGGTSLQFCTLRRLFCNFQPFMSISALFPTNWGISTIFCSSRAFLQFPANWRLLCNFLEQQGFFYNFFIFPGFFCNFCTFRGFFCNFSIPEVFSALPGAFMTFLPNRGLPCNPLDSGDISVIFPLGQFCNSCTFWRSEGGEEEGDRRWGHLRLGVPTGGTPPSGWIVGGGGRSQTPSGWDRPEGEEARGAFGWSGLESP